MADPHMTRFIPYPRGFGKYIAKSPLVMIRMGLGDALTPLHVGVITTRGRASGKPRHTVMNYRRHGNTLYVISAWGEQVHWVQNLIAQPAATVRLGRFTAAVHGEIVQDGGEIVRALHLFRKYAPAAIIDPMLARVAGQTQFSPRDLHMLSERVTVVRLRIQPVEPQLPPLPINLSWIWLASACATVGMTLSFGVVRLLRVKKPASAPHF
jgi:deazaflavin-dependent oxidoreductase (nitroreductase family)